MSSDITVGQEQEFGLNDFKDTKGFLAGARVKYTNLEYVKHTWPARGEQPENDVVFVKATVQTAKNQKSLTIEYDTRLKWEDKFTVSADGKNLIAKSKDARLPKNTEFYHLLTAFVNSGYIAKNEATTNLSKYIGADVIMISETVPGSKSTREKPYPDAVAGENQGVAALSTSSASASAPAGPSIEPEIVPIAKAALSAIITQRGRLERNELAKEVGNYLSTANVTGENRTKVLMAFYSTDNLRYLADGLGYRVEGTTVTA